MLSLNSNWDGLTHNQFSHCKKPPSHTSLYRCLCSAAWWPCPAKWIYIHREAPLLGKPRLSMPRLSPCERMPRERLRSPWGCGRTIPTTARSPLLILLSPARSWGTGPVSLWSKSTLAPILISEILDILANHKSVFWTPLSSSSLCQGGFVF